jgi:hypothetical protein
MKSLNSQSWGARSQVAKRTSILDGAIGLPRLSRNIIAGIPAPPENTLILETTQGPVAIERRGTASMPRAADPNSGDS